ncbi:MAG: ATP-binding cassette domain-containing protein [Geitlerinemataceae cyanobacterium]
MIEVEQLSKIYGTTQAIQDVTFGVEKGDILGFLGPNGAGKTTTMRILAGFLPATSGTARIAGYDVHEQSMAVRQRIGYLPETPPLYPDMTVRGFLNFVAQIKGVSAGDRPKRIESAIDRCGLSQHRKTLIRKLSKGFRQRVGIAQAIVHDPPVIILDEPTVGLDPRQIIEVRNLIKSLAGEHTIILSTHILPEVNMTCNQVAIIKRGQVVATDKIENLMSRLRGGIAYEVEIQGDVEGLDTSLESLFDSVAGVKSIELLPRDHLPDNRYKLRISTEPSVEPSQAIADTVVKAGLGLCEMHRVQASLEDVFLELTMEEVGSTEVERETETPEERPQTSAMEDTEG